MHHVRHVVHLEVVVVVVRHCRGSIGAWLVMMVRASLSVVEVDDVVAKVVMVGKVVHVVPGGVVVAVDITGVVAGFEFAKPDGVDELAVHD